MLLKGNLKGIQHVGLPVTDIEKSKAFYLEFGFEEIMRKDLPEKDETVKVAMLKKDDLILELYQLNGAELKEIAARKDGHIDHIALDVIDIEEAYKEIKNSELEIIEEQAPVFLPFWENGVKYFSVRGPNGEKVEFNQKL